MGQIKKLHFNEINGWPNLGKIELYPITTTTAVFTEDNRNLDVILKNIETALQTGVETPQPIVSEGTEYLWAFIGAKNDQEALAKLNKNEEVDIPTGWSNNSNISLLEGDMVYLTTARKKNGIYLLWTTYPDVGAVWSTPVRLGGNSTSTTGTDIPNHYNYIYCRTAKGTVLSLNSLIGITVEDVENAGKENKGIEINTRRAVSITESTVNVWCDHPLDISTKYPDVYMAIYEYINDSYILKAGPILWSRYGQDGKDGDGYEYIYTKATKKDAPVFGNTIYGRVKGDTILRTVQVSNIEKDIYYQQDDFIPDGWYDNPIEVDEDQPVQYVSVRKKSYKDDGEEHLWQMFSLPTVWSENTKGDTIQTLMIFGAASSSTTSPNNVLTDSLRANALIPKGWSTFPNFAIRSDERVWMSSCTIKNGNYVKTDGYIWALPLPLTGEPGANGTSSTGVDGADIHFIYYRSKTAQTLTTPLFSVEDISNAEIGLNKYGQPISEEDEGWRESPLGVDSDNIFEYISINYKASGVAGTTQWIGWSAPVLWSKYGLNGMDGDGVEYIFCLSTELLTTESQLKGLIGETFGHESGGDSYQDDDFIPDNPLADNIRYTQWEDDVQSISEAWPYEYVSMRKKSKNVWGSFSVPALWSKYGRDGKDGKATSYTLVSDNDTVILDDDSLSANVLSTVANTIVTLQNDGKPVTLDVVYEIADTSYGLSDTDYWKITLLPITSGDNKGSAKLIYTANSTAKLPINAVYSTIVNAYITEGDTKEFVASRKQLIQIKNFSNDGSVYKLVVAPNTLNADSNSKFKESTDLNITVNLIKADNSISVLDIPITNRYAVVLPLTLYINIIAYSISSQTSALMLSSITSTKISKGASAPLYYVVNLYLKTSDSSILVDSETINVSCDGRNGEAGPKGDTGAQGCQGIDGCILRLSKWASGVNYKNDGALTTGTRYIDLVWDDSNVMYICKTSHTSTTSIQADINNWTMLSKVDPQYIPILKTDNLIFKVGQGDQLFLTTPNGHIVGGMTGYISAENNNIRLFIGTDLDLWDSDQTLIEDAPFKVYEDGSLEATKAKITGEINATSGSFKGAVTATSFNVLNLMNGETVIEMTLWDSDKYTALGFENIPNGTPVIIAHFLGKDYIMNLTERLLKEGSSPIRTAYTRQYTLNITELFIKNPSNLLIIYKARIDGDHWNYYKYAAGDTLCSNGYYAITIGDNKSIIQSSLKTDLTLYDYSTEIDFTDSWDSIFNLIYEEAYSNQNELLIEVIGPAKNNKPSDKFIAGRTKIQYCVFELVYNGRLDIISIYVLGEVEH